MENSPKLESMPTLCTSATLPPETTISKWRVAATTRKLLQLPTGGTSAFRGLRAIASLQPPSNFRDAPVFQSHQLPLYGNERLEWQIPTQLPKRKKMETENNKKASETNSRQIVLSATKVQMTVMARAARKWKLHH